MNHLSFSEDINPQQLYHFTTAQEALRTIPTYRQRLAAIAKSYHSLGKVVSDQDYPVEMIVLRPLQTETSSLILMGGMGPLAGIDGFEQACKLFQNSREIVLLQASKVPNRATVMAEKLQTVDKTDLEFQLVTLLEKFMGIAVSQINSGQSRIPVIFLCNAVHYFLPQVRQRLARNHPEIAKKIEWVSLIESVVQHLQNQNLQRPLLLCTTATRQGKTYANLLKDKNIDLIEPNESLQSLLMDCIYQGVKAFDSDYACKFGEQLFVELLTIQPDMDCIIAGCSEIPLLIEWLKAKTNGVVAEFLRQIKVINPVQIALEFSA